MLRPSLRLLAPAAFVGLCLTAVVPFACSASSEDGELFGDGGSGAATGGAGGGVIIDGGNNGTACGCSADLHDILDCDGNVIETCPPDKGCAPGGECVDPCASAEANKSSIGCDFYSVIPGPEYETRGSCFAVMLANTWTSPITIEASHGATIFDGSAITRVPTGSGASLAYQPLDGGQLNPGEIGIVFLSQFPSGDVYWVPCPAGVTAGLNADPSIDGTGVGNAFRITTSAPVVAYDIFPYGGAASFVSSATLLVPTPTWGDNFVASDAYAANPSLSFVNGYPHIQIVAAQDDTEVTISPTTAIVGGPGVAPTGAGVPATYTLSAGQVVQFMQAERLVGSPISSNKPISVWGGTACMNVPIGSFACDSAHQELLPVSTLGSEYVGTRYRDRVVGANEIVPYQLVGAVDGTTLAYDPAPPAGAPTALASGQVAEFSTSEPFVVRSQDADHPFYMAAYMTGASAVLNNVTNTGDPEYVNVVTPKQYLSQYLFLTDPTYRNTHLVFVRSKDDDGAFHDVELSCLGTVGGWTPIGSGLYEYARVDLVTEGVPQNGCDNGVHTAESSRPFGVTVWGWDVTVSYAYPAGMSVEPINTVVVPPVPN